jgi:hypothetical protein
MENKENSPNKNYEEQILKSFLEFLKEKCNIQSSDIIKLLKENEQIQIPCSIFNKKLGCLESIVKYLKEEKELNYEKIALFLFRKPGPIGVTYRNAKKKHQEKFSLDFKYSLPVNVFSNAKLSVLENITFYLKNHYDLTFHKISVLLQRDDRTIWTVYNKAIKKLKYKKDGENSEKK